MIASPLLLAAALTVPTFRYAEARALSNGIGDIARDEAALADVEVVVQPDGSIRSCDIVRGWGNRSTLERICPQVLKFKVDGIAKVGGEPAFGKFRTRLTLTEGRPSGDLPPRRPDYTLTVAAMPEGAGPQVDVYIVAYIGADGEVRECAGGGGQTSPFYVAACGQLGPDFLTPVTDTEGNTVPYVLGVSVRFVGPEQAEDKDGQ